VLASIGEQQTVAECLTSAKGYVKDHSKQIGGTILLIVGIYFAFYYYYKTEASREDEDEKELKKKKKESRKEKKEKKKQLKKGIPPIETGPKPNLDKVEQPKIEGGDRGSKGAHIKFAQDARWTDQLKSMVRDRDTMRQEIQDYKKSLRADLADNFYDNMEFYDQQIATLTKLVDPLTVEIQAIYNQQMGDGVKKGKAKNTQKSIPNDEKDRKQIKVDNKEIRDKKKGESKDLTPFLSRTYKLYILKTLSPAEIRIIRQAKILKPNQQVCSNSQCINVCNKNDPKLLCGEHHQQNKKNLIKTAVEKDNEAARPIETGKIKRDYPDCKFGRACYSLDSTRQRKQNCLFRHPDKEVMIDVKPLVGRKLEAQVIEVNNPQSHSRQTPTTTKLPIFPLYIKSGDSYIRNGTGFRAKDPAQENKVRLFTAWHVTRNGLAYVRMIGGEYSQVNFTKLGNELSVAEDNSLLSLPATNISICSETDEKPSKLKFWTVSVPGIDQTNSVQNMTVSTDGHWTEADLYSHVSDTFGAQCGSPYISQNKVFAIHDSTDNRHNHGEYVHCKARNSNSDFCVLGSRKGKNL
jgi:hypothetical protein